MKKEFVYIILTILLINIIIAQTPQPTDPNPPATPTTTANPAASAISTVKSKTDGALEKEIELPRIINIFLKTKGPVELSFLIMLVCIWLFMLLFIYNVLRITPFFKGITAFLAAVIVLLLIGLAGGLNFFTSILLETGSIFKFLEEWTTGALIFGIVILIIILFVVSKAVKFIKSKEEKEENEIAAREIGTRLGFLGSIKKWFTWSNKISQ